MILALADLTMIVRVFSWQKLKKFNKGLSFLRVCL